MKQYYVFDITESNWEIRESVIVLEIGYITALARLKSKYGINLDFRLVRVIQFNNFID